ncbi:CBS domain-containing protein [Acetohalobium arabaticum]|uniref:Polynucleotide adenylyltransferase region n=1 Tax=Acetohalobium arabaticum (strain ATCC 49924 / DSM 5501 / Z-7288) TaxID=574087 RepID=D9QRQ1_ACEAZ|nr:CBS domain-containing protein [Acetohalobium arabaticum]ADL13192.1 Polynucleotide adenylyltransferase region [Acetohalobium arabaticum DSM 5501]
MQLITGHKGTDFDSLAAMVAASKLYPEATMVFPGRLSQNVKDFMSLYKDRISVKRPNQLQTELEQNLIDSLIIVDTRLANRLGELKYLAFDSEVELIIYDHHPELDEELTGAWELIEPVGAVTSLLCQQIERRGLEITSFEATLFMLGIYEDTGSLMFNSTTSTDAAAVSFLLENDANLSVVNQFIERPLSSIQQDLFTQLLDSLQAYELDGLEVDVYKAELDEYIGGIAYLTQKLDDLNQADVLFTLVRLDNKILIVARSNVDTLDVSTIVTEYGGGGHRRAASAMVRDKKLALSQLEEEIITMVEEKMEPLVLAGDIMSSPVQTITPDKSMEEAEEKMLCYGHSGLIVTEDEDLVGVISRRDVDKVKQHDLMHAPVKGYMSRQVVTIREDTTFKDIQQKLVEYDIGRLPVLNRNNELVGIVTRSDVLRVLYGEADYIKGMQNRYGCSMVEVSQQTFNVKNILKKMESEEYKLLSEIGKIADNLELDVYIVGGFVRDLILGVENFDFDIVVEGNGIKFARELAEELEGEVIEEHQEFGTACVATRLGLKLDVASCRVEYYQSPGALPEVEASDLKQDLFRRDFTLNALAIKLNSERFGKLIDFFGGKEDLEAGLIRILHNFSFIDDPTRIFRALRFVNRYDFELGQITRELMEHAIDQKVVEGVSLGRLSNELELILKEETAAEILSDLEEFDLLKFFHPQLSWTAKQSKLASEIPWAERWVEELEIEEELAVWQLYLLLLVNPLSVAEAKSLLTELKISNDIIAKVEFIKESDKEKLELLREFNVQPSEVYNSLKSLSLEELVYLVIVSENTEVKDWIEFYLLELRRIELQVTGKDIIELGYEPGPCFEKALQAVKTKKLNGELETYEAERNYLEKYLICLKEEDN